MVEEYTKCELQGLQGLAEWWRSTPSVSFRVSRALKHFPNLLFTVVGHYTYPLILYLVAIVDCTHVGSATASFKDLVTIAQENVTNQNQKQMF